MGDRMDEPSTDSGFADLDDDYRVVRFSLEWGLLSIAAFVVTLAVNVVANDLRASFATAGLSVLGLVFGLLGLKAGRGGRRGARTGASLNGVVVVIFLVLAVVVVVLRGARLSG